MHYDKSSKNYKGSTLDNLNRRVDGFEIDGKIHLVYNHGTINQLVTKRSIIEIKENPDAFLWTPYIEFIDIDVNFDSDEGKNEKS